MIALIDGDIIRYRVGFASQYNIHRARIGEHLVKETSSKVELNEWLKSKGEVEGLTVDTETLYDDEANVLHSVDSMVRTIIRDSGSDDYRIFLSGEGNFRNDIYPEYKANRKDAERPKFYQTISDYLILEWGAILVDGMEADDALGMAQTDDTIICSIDKDLKQVPGWHYDFVKEKKMFVSEIEGYRSFYKQMITGDTGDNIPGLSEKKPLKRTYSEKPINDMDTEGEMADYVYTGYIQKYVDEDEAIKMFNLNKDLLWIKRSTDDNDNS